MDREPSPGQVGFSNRRCIVLLNPNTSTASTRIMLASLQPDTDAEYRIEGRTVPTGVALITNPAELQAAISVTVETGVGLAAEGADGIVIAGFGDPGLFELRRRVQIPVVGIAEAGMLEAADAGQRFSVVTTTPSLSDSIREMAHRYGVGELLASVRVTACDPTSLMSEPLRLEKELMELALEAMRDDRVDAILVGGGPLAAAARTMRELIPIPVIEPVPASLRLLKRRLATTGGSRLD